MQSRKLKTSAFLYVFMRDEENNVGKSKKGVTHSNN